MEVVKLNIKTKFILTSIITFTISILGISAYMYYEYTDSYSDQVNAADGQILSQLSYNLDIYLDEIYRLTLLPYYNESVLALLRDGSAGTLQEKYVKKYTIENFLINTLISPRKDIQRAVIISDGLYFSEWNSNTILTYEQQVNSGWYKKIREEKKPMVLLPGTDDSYRPSQNPSFSVVNAILDVNDDFSVIGVIRVEANYNTIRDLCSKVDMGKEGGVLILSEDNAVIYASLDAPKKASLLKKLAGVPDEGHLRDFRYEGDLINSISLNHFGWRLVSVNSLDTMKIQMDRIRNTILVGVCLTFLCTSVLLYLTMSRYFKPFYRIIGLMKTAQRGFSSVRYRGSSRDEFGYLGNTFNSMLDNLNEMYEQNAELDKKIYQAHLFQRETEIQLLYSQIRPHFTYNTLNMISIQIQMGQYEQAVDSINKLGLIMRGVAYINKEIPLKMEMAIVASYLSIQQARYGEKLSFAIDIDKSLEELVIPSLILQPVVENVVLHCCECSHKKIHIRVYSRMTGRKMEIDVEDDGEGIPPEKLDELNRNFTLDAPSPGGRFVSDLPKAGGLGLANVNTRIRMHFGKAFGLRVESVPGKGTTVRIHLPGPCDDTECGGIREAVL